MDKLTDGSTEKLPTVAEALQKGSLRLHGWVYDIGEGALFVLDPESDRFQKLDV